METIALRPLEQTRRRALTAGAGLAAAALVVVVPTVDGALRTGYRPSQHWISHLALGPGGWVIRTVLVIAGVLVAVAAVGLRRSLGAARAPGRSGRWPPAAQG